MRIICIEEQDSPLSASGYNNSCQLSLMLGKSYVVYAIMIDDVTTWACIRDEVFSSPMWYPLRCFDIQDQRLSRFWIFNSWKQDNKNMKRLIFAFPEWANHQSFYGDLFDGDEQVCATFHKYEKLMNLEFPDPNVVESAQVGDGQWLICSLCIDAWQNQSQDALVICPKCQTILNNPRYRNERSI